MNTHFTTVAHHSWEEQILLGGDTQGPESLVGEILVFMYEVTLRIHGKMEFKDKLILV